MHSKEHPASLLRSASPNNGERQRVGGDHWMGWRDVGRRDGPLPVSLNPDESITSLQMHIMHAI